MGQFVNKSWLTGIGRAQFNKRGECLLVFPIPVEVRDSNEVKVCAIKEICIAACSGHLIVGAISLS